MTDTWTGRPIGRVRSSLTDLAAAPKQGAESAQTAWIDYTPELAAGFADIAVGDRLVVLTWLHHARRDLLTVHPRDDPRNPLTGVFSTRSADRPTPSEYTWSRCSHANTTPCRSHRWRPSTARTYWT